jgi:hypothetical protein
LAASPGSKRRSFESSKAKNHFWQAGYDMGRLNFMITAQNYNIGTFLPAYSAFNIVPPFTSVNHFSAKKPNFLKITAQYLIKALFGMEKGL